MSEQGNNEDKSQAKEQSSGEAAGEKIKSEEVLKALVEKIRTAAVVDVSVKVQQEKGGDDDGQKGKEGGGDGKGSEKGKGEKKGPPAYKRPEFIMGAVIVFLVLVVVGLLLWLHYRQFVSTDDAYIDADVVPMSSQVPGRVMVMHMADNELVHKGDLLIEIDPIDYEVALQQAQAQKVDAEGRLAQARAEIDSARANVAQAQAAIDAAQVSLDNANQDFHRYETVDPRARSQQQLDNATANQRSAQANLERANAQKASGEAGVASSEAAVKMAEGNVAVAEAGVRKAEVNLGYCRIAAPSDGRVTLRTVNPGDYVAPGQAMFSLVSPNVWITANFKETQLRLMRPGQPVTIKVDAYPDMKLDGHVDSLQAGSGARFSVLPAENATGNFVKIVQRVPVKILLENGSNTNDVRLCAPGLSVKSRVKIR